MGKRTPPIKAIYDKLVEERGEVCHGLPGFECDRKPPQYRLVVDHVDNDENNWAWTNLQLLCIRCNRKKNPPKVSKKIFPVGTHQSVCVRVIKRRPRESKPGEVDSDREPPELRISREREPIWVNWLYENITRQNGLTLAEAEYEGAFACGVNPVTVRRWFKKQYYGGVVDLGAGPRGNQKVIWRVSEEEEKQKLVREAKAEADRILGKGDPDSKV